MAGQHQLDFQNSFFVIVDKQLLHNPTSYQPCVLAFKQITFLPESIAGVLASEKNIYYY